MNGEFGNEREKKAQDSWVESLKLRQIKEKKIFRGKLEKVKEMFLYAKQQGKKYTFLCFKFEKGKKKKKKNNNRKKTEKAQRYKD